MKKLLILILVLISGNAVAQQDIDAGIFDDVYLLQPGKADFDSTYINTAGGSDFTATYGMWPILSIDYLFNDTGTVGSTLIFQQNVKDSKGRETDRWVSQDSLVVSSTSTDWQTWLVTASGSDIPPKPLWRIEVASHAAEADTCQLKGNGWNNQR
ncbi:hypothetical protein LCGC14_1421350 [marine sediment metagenome]|uniref:Uncharacterized protein n=2 Tax=root TaxID=1 RepID=A0A831QJZ0_9FLAO|nr:hypothetical protein [Pricia antarctica]